MNIAILTYAKDQFRVESIDRLVVEAGLRGHVIRRIRYMDCTMGVEDGRATIYYRGEKLQDIDAVIPWVIQGSFMYGMEVLRHFDAMGVWVLNSAAAFAYSYDKWSTAQALVAADIPTPNTYRALNYQGVYTCVDRLSDQTAVIKAATSTKGRGVVLSKDKMTTKAIAGSLASVDGGCVIQDFIQESSGTDLRAYVVGEDVVAAMERRTENDFRSNLHLGGRGVAVELSKQEERIAVWAAQALGLNVGGIDLMRSSRGPMVIEANASGGFGIEAITGVNVASKIIEYVELNAKRRNKKDKVGA